MASSTTTAGALSLRAPKAVAKDPQERDHIPGVSCCPYVNDHPPRWHTTREASPQLFGIQPREDAPEGVLQGGHGAGPGRSPSEPASGDHTVPPRSRGRCHRSRLGSQSGGCFPANDTKPGTDGERPPRHCFILVDAAPKPGEEKGPALSGFPQKNQQGTFAVDFIPAPGSGAACDWSLPVRMPGTGGWIGRNHH